MIKKHAEWSVINKHIGVLQFINNGFLLSASCTCDYNLSYN